jgi:hypothetical protein
MIRDWPFRVPVDTISIRRAVRVSTVGPGVTTVTNLKVVCMPVRVQGTTRSSLSLHRKRDDKAVTAAHQHGSS